MTLIPALTHPDNYPVPNWESIALSPDDDAVRAILRMKRNPESRVCFEQLRPHGFLDVDLICTHARRYRHTALDWEVEDYRQGQEALGEVLAPTRRIFGQTIRASIPESVRLYRVTHSTVLDVSPVLGSGIWWADSAMVARREGAGRSKDPALFTAMIPTTSIVARTRTRFGKGGTSPAEFIVDPEGIEIERVDA